jgi:tRNA modification GTPase
MSRADRILFVIDAQADPQAKAWLEERGSLPTEVPVTLLMNKLDASGETQIDFPAIERLEGVSTVLGISAKTGTGLDALRNHLESSMGHDPAAGGVMSARARHLEALRRAESHAEKAFRQLTESRAGELVAEELRIAQSALGEITGEFHAEDLLGRIFGSFCIGK